MNRSVILIAGVAVFVLLGSLFFISPSGQPSVAKGPDTALSGQVASDWNANSDTPVSPSTPSGAGVSSGSAVSGVSSSPSTPTVLVGGEERPAYYCKDADRAVKDCEPVQHQVCGWFTQQDCSGGPCVQLFVNECEACQQADIAFWTEPDCPIHG